LVPLPRRKRKKKAKRFQVREEKKRLFKVQTQLKQVAGEMGGGGKGGTHPPRKWGDRRTSTLSQNFGWVFWLAKGTNNFQKKNDKIACGGGGGKGQKGQNFLAER